MIDPLKTIGIEKGKPFKPDAKTQKILNDAAREAHAWLDLKYEGVFSPPFNEGTHWALPATPDVAEGLHDEFRQARRLPRGGPRRRAIPWRISAPSTWGRASTT